MRPGNLIKYKDENLSPFIPSWGLAVKLCPEEYRLWVYWNTGEYGWEYIRELEPLTMKNFETIVKHK
jgi:hypothetical protein